MNDLTAKKCVPCEGGVPAIEPAAARAMMSQLDKDWRLVEDGRALKREFKFVDFYRTMSFVNAVAHIANIEDHHPDLEVGWGYCRMRWSTHAVNGLTENDFICAAKVDQLATR